MQPFVVLIAAYFMIHLAAADVWHYPKEQPNGVLENDEDWGGMCSSGKRQSPVDLHKDAAVRGRFPGFIFQNYDTSMASPSIINNGHSIQISTTPGPISVSGGGLPGTYIFDQMHFHWASEHTVNGARFALELHMVHHEKRYDSLTKAAQAKNGIAVLGILFYISMEPNPVVEKILENSKTVFEAAGKTSVYKDKLYLQDLLPKNQVRFFRYEGSLTTPACGEAVVWTVFEQAIPISEDQLERFKSVHDPEGHELTHNYRHIQPLNSRALIYVQSDSAEYGADFGGGNNSINLKYSLPLMIISAIIGLIGMKV